MPIPTVKQLAQVPHGRMLAGMAGAPLDAGGLRNALNFSGAAPVCTIANASSLNVTAGLTIAVWIKPRAFQTANPFISGLVSKSLNATAAYELRLGDLAVANNKAQFIINGTKLAGTVGYAVNVWYLLTATYDGSVARLYTNGVLDTSLAINAAITTNTEQLTIGQDFGGRFFSGLMAAPRLWNRALSSGEIGALTSSNAASRNGLIGEWLLDEGGGTSLSDSSGQGNAGTISGLTFSADVPQF